MFCSPILVLEQRNLVFATNLNFLVPINSQPETEFKEFELQLKFETLLKYGWFLLKLYSIFKI